MKFTIYFDKEQADKHMKTIEHMNPFAGLRPFSQDFAIDAFAADIDGIDQLICESMIKLSLAYGDMRISWISNQPKNSIQNMDVVEKLAKQIQTKVAFYLKRSEKIKDYLHLADKNFAGIYIIAEYIKDGFSAKCAFEQAIAKKHYENCKSYSYSDPYFIATELKLS